MKSVESRLNRIFQIGLWAIFRLDLCRPSALTKTQKSLKWVIVSSRKKRELYGVSEYVTAAKFILLKCILPKVLYTQIIHARSVACSTTTQSSLCNQLENLEI